jgi:hypothetical protein
VTQFEPPPVAVDVHPAGNAGAVTPSKFSSGGNPPSGELLACAKPMAPASAIIANHWLFMTSLPGETLKKALRATISL